MSFRYLLAIVLVVALLSACTDTRPIYLPQSLPDATLEVKPARVTHGNGYQITLRTMNPDRNVAPIFVIEGTTRWVGTWEDGVVAYSSFITKVPDGVAPFVCVTWFEQGREWSICSETKSPDLHD